MLRPKIRNTIEKVVHDVIHSVEIERIDIQEDVDFNDDDVLRIRIVFDGSLPDPKEMVSLGRLLRESLLGLNEERVPHTSYISATDARRLPAA